MYLGEKYSLSRPMINFLPKINQLSPSEEIFIFEWIFIARTSEVRKGVQGRHEPREMDFKPLDLR